MGEAVKGCGVDIIEIERIRRACMRFPFVDKIFTEREQLTLKAKGISSWAARFAGKEAVMKSLGCGWQRGISFHHIEIVPDQWGKPTVELSSRAREIALEQGICRVLISLSHNRETAIAYTVAVGEESE